MEKPGNAGGVFLGGRLRVEPEGPVPAAGSGTWALTLDLDGLPKGGRVLIVFPQMWTGPQVGDPGGAGYLTLSPEGSVFNLSFELNRLTLTAREEIPPGFSCRLTWGDRAGGGPGTSSADMDSFASDAIETLFASADPEGTGRFLDFVKFPTIPVRGRAASRLALHVPFEAVVGRPTRIHLAALDEFGNVDPSFTGGVRVASEGTAAGPPEARVQLGPMDRGVRVVEGVVFPSPGVARLRAETAGSGLASRSGPVSVRDREPGLKVFFGDIHGHTTLTDANIDEKGYYRYARDVMGLDFSAITDHDWVLNMTRKDPLKALDPAGWEAIRRANDDFYRPGRFVTLLGYEWIRPDPNRGNTDMNFGHLTIVYPDNNGPIFWPDSTDTATPLKIAEKLRGIRCLLIPHQTLYASPDHLIDRIDLEQFRLVEIYSSWGSSESDEARLVTKRTRDRIKKRPRKGESVIDYLRGGYRFGIICSTDAHSYPCRPSRRKAGAARPDHVYGCAMCGVYARDLTREGIFEALWNRRCFGTTGARIVPSFRVNGAFMGETARAAPGEPRRIEAEVTAANDLDVVEVVKNGDVAFSASPSGLSARLSWEDRAGGPGVDFYYLRVVQKDEAMAWSSPVWVEPP